MSKQKKEKATFPELPQEGFVRLPHLLHLLGGISKTTLYTGIQDGTFPAPRRLTKRTSVWPVEDVRALIERVSAGGAHA